MVDRQLLHRLGQGDLQDAILKLGGHILGLHLLTHIEAAAALTGVALPAQITAILLLLVLIQALGGTDGQTTVLQLQLNLILLEAGQVHIQLIGVLGLPHIGLHQVLAVLAVQRVAGKHVGHSVKGILEKVVKQIFTKQAR